MRVILLYTMFLILSFSKVNAQFYVDPFQGNDKNIGSLKAPFKTIERAQASVREVNQVMSRDLLIYLR